MQKKGIHTLEPAAVTSDYITALSLVQVWILVCIHNEQKVSKEEDPENSSCAVTGTIFLQPRSQRGHGHKTWERGNTGEARTDSSEPCRLCSGAEIPMF